VIAGDGEAARLHQRIGHQLGEARHDAVGADAGLNKGATLDYFA